MIEKYHFINAQKTCHSIRTLSKILGVNRSAYYRWTHKPKSDKALKDEVYSVHIRAIHSQYLGTYGALRVTAALRKKGIAIGHNRVARLMRKIGVHGLPYKPKRFRSTSNQNGIVYENILNREFQTDKPNRVWAGDITYIWTREGWLYLSVIIDIFSRKAISFIGGNHMRTSLIEHCLERAITLRSPLPGLIHHSDRGSQYTSNNYQEKLRANNFRSSMSRAGNCWDNAVVESFFGRLKTECINRQKWVTRSEAFEAVKHYINNFYNPIRAHSANGGKSPNQMEYDYYQLQKQNAA